MDIMIINFYGPDHNFEEDVDRLVELDIKCSDNKLTYVLASRTTDSSSRFSLREYFDTYKYFSTSSIYTPSPVGYYRQMIEASNCCNGVRPVVTLKSNVRFVDGIGSKGNPYKLAI